MKKNIAQKGSVITLSVLIFVIATVVLGTGVAVPIVKHIQAIRGATASRQALYASEAAYEDAVWRLKKSMLISSTETLVVGSSTATVTISGTTQKQIASSADTGGYSRMITGSVSETEGTSFNYGLQTGLGGFHLSGGATINGSVYSNGDIISDNTGPSISGSAIVASRSNPIADQSNAGDLSNPPYGIDFGGNVTPRDVAQSFKVSTTTSVTSVRVYIKKHSNNWMRDAVVKIVNNSGSNPGGSVLASASLFASNVTTSYSYLTLPFSSTVSLSPNTTYWLVIQPTDYTWNEYYTLAATDATYASGTAKAGAWSSGSGGTWNATSPSTLDGYFDIFLGGDTGKIYKMNVGTSGSGDAWAHDVSDSTVAGTIYCQSGEDNNKNCNTSRTDPVEQPYPLSDGNISDFKTQAAAGGTYNGNYSVGWAGATLGPKKIVGNLTVDGGGTLTLTGPLWVTGNISVSGGGKIKLSSSMGSNSSYVISDGKIIASGGSAFAGSGSTGSYLMVITTSTCPIGAGCSGNDAIEISGGAGAVILNAQNGTVYISGGASLRQVTAYKVEMPDGTITYDTGLANINFTSGPSGTWAIDSWQESVAQ